ncbi:MAG: hypothetical protein OSA39_01965 [Sphingobium sp.]|nr:hypothetical protein [Sphingobium sp.]
MDSIETTFTALSRRMAHLSVPTPITTAQPPLSSLIDRVNAAKQQYQPGMRR